ncbi:hypothetical protein D9758_002389 [Tetrapyrgos nigripes]|uniref:Heterokaryon incompatibility domain-containing protein n=1 Tax=Tetrapyrgos nigripes TaxID=182062 RepID=A0A8H5LSR0_9AGAR|nr:hypothetical protein D9758_002389 [Tetrapyrgos nigripes]
MRLLNTKTLQLHEFYSDIPTYAILSHTWDREEVTFQDMQNLRAAKRKAGYAKLWGACAHARQYNFEWIWIDSCCINKESSAELSEAINSMDQYYRNSEVCYVYLADAPSAEDPRDMESGFRRSRWFKRGWTLQELLAPRYCVFLGKDWEEIGTRWSLRDAISALTRIPTRVFEDGDTTRYSIAQKMSWAAFRETTRPEDQAYCLMGLFGVNMPPLYGEGCVKAFMRLQQEIIKVSDDRSIFAWIAPIGKQGSRGLFAKSPFEFRMSGEVMASETDTIDEISSYSFANNGLHIHLPLKEVSGHPGDESDNDDDNEDEGPMFLGDDSDNNNDQDMMFLASLHCRSQKDNKYLSVYLRRIKGRQYVRCRADELALTPSPPAPNSLQELVVKENNHSSSFTLCRKQRDVIDGLAFIVKLSDIVTQDHLVFVSSRSTTGPSTTFDELTSCVTIAPGDITYLEYGIRSPNGTSQTLLVLLHNWNLHSDKALVQTANHFWQSDPNDWEPGLSDCILLPVTNGDLVSLQYRNTGIYTEKILEISYVSRADALTALKRNLTLPAASLMVPVHEEGLDLQRISFSDFFDVDCGPNQQYLAFHRSTYRILTYSVEQWWLKEIFDVALGFRGNLPWVYISPHGQKLEVDGRMLDLAAYFNLVSQRTDCQWPRELQASSMTLKTSFSTITATIEARTTLQLGSHLLRLDFPFTHVDYDY